MARKKMEKQSTGTVQPQRSLPLTIEELNLAESYKSLLVGLTVVLIGGGAFFTFMRGYIQFPQAKQETLSNKTEQPTNKITLPTTHTVTAGEDLSTISEKYYKTKERWVDIANANNISVTDVIQPGTKLTIPAIAAPILQPGEKITGDNYVVQEGDQLWDIAVRAYGDGYRWVDIVNANSLQNPDAIPAGTVLKIPR